MKIYDILLMQLDTKMRPLVLNESRDIMAVITAYNEIPTMADAEFAGTLLAIYLLHISKVPMDSNTLAPFMDEVRIALEAITQLRNKIMDKSDDNQFEGYLDGLKKQGKKYEA